MIRRQYSIFFALTTLGLVYALWTQPYMGRESLSSALARSSIIAAWISLFFIVRNRRHATWSWKKFFIGAMMGGGALPLGFLMADSVVKSLVVLSVGMVLGTISGLYASLASTVFRAGLLGLGMLLAQISLDVLVHAMGLTRYSYGM